MSFVLVLLFYAYGATLPYDEVVYQTFGGPEAEMTCNEVKARLEIDTTYGLDVERFCINAKYYHKE